MSVPVENDSNLYVVVNTSCLSGPLARPGEHPVLPFEAPHTYGSLSDALECLATAVEDGEADISSLRIFQLIPPVVKQGDRTKHKPGVYLVRQDTTRLYGIYFVEAVVLAADEEEAMEKVKDALAGEEGIFLDEERIQVFRLADGARIPPAHGVNHPPGREVFGVVIGQDMP